MKLKFCIAVALGLLLLVALSCDRRNPTAFTDSPILELFTTDSVITFPFPTTLDNSGNPVTQDYVDVQARVLSASRGLISDTMKVYFQVQTGRITGVAETDQGVAHAPLRRADELDRLAAVPLGDRRLRRTEERGLHVL